MVVSEWRVGVIVGVRRFENVQLSWGNALVLYLLRVCVPVSARVCACLRIVEY